MGDAKYLVHDGRRWRELDLRSGCVWGWGAVSFAYARRGQLVPVSRARVLRALRARAAGVPGPCAVKDGPPLPEIRNLRPGRKSNDRRTPKRKRTARRMTDPPLHTTHQYNSQEVLSCSTDVNFDSSILKPWNRERVTTGVQTTCTTQSVGVQATWATKPVGLQATWATTPLDVQATWATTPLDVQATWATKPVSVQTENNWQRNETEELRNGDGREGMTDDHGSEESRKEALLGRKEQLQDPLFRKHLLITEQEVTWLRNFLVKDNVLGADLKKFDFDDTYKAQLLYRLNPIVDAERCPRIARMLRERTSRADATQRPRSGAGTSAGRSSSTESREQNSSQPARRPHVAPPAVGTSHKSCTICDYKSIYNSHIVRHMRTHTGDKPFTCQLCNYKCAENSDLVRHMRTHTGEKPFACKLCKYKCTRNTDLVRHMRTHSGKKPFAREIYNYKCAENSDLVKHMRTHTGEKPFACKLCKYKCTRNTDLVRHMRTHTDDKPFACKLCNYKCTQSSPIVRHMRTHTGEKPFTCKLCTYTCAENSDLVRHMSTHSGEKPFSCKLCKYKCTRTSDLVRHMRTHTGEKPFACKLCMYKCTVKSSLVRHMRTHTS